MTKTLILFAHPRPSASKANRVMLDAATSLPGVEVRNLYTLYPDGRIDTDAEVAALLSADRIVLQFPVQWYSTPPLLKAWQDEVLTRMYYIAFETEGARMAGKPLLIAATAGNVPRAYSSKGANLYPLAKLLRPLKAMANRCALVWNKPFLAYAADRLDAAGMERLADRYLKRLTAFAALIPAERPRRCWFKRAA
ncbi:NAD(P)H-dependent oxidoreductase [Phenylobacterium aquaticum]|uniref:NAD(P)H-dependent oxidoreductase n=1 Tax=Phenylobacterium aquaticum TaxID=1763816 RepID=UPI001F5E0F80|nr:NAD(P)H-dependent oxidoreductase [Phenylobacterium aquaticum]MCI3134936.1 NAD(P)H-dependent oxidoreductase [Phenylobacterium aquaticum]